MNSRVFSFSTSGFILKPKLTTHFISKFFSSSLNKTAIQGPQNAEIEKTDTNLNKAKLKLFEIMSVYEEAIGLKEVKLAQQNVLEAEKNFVNAQKGRRSLSLQLIEVQEKLRGLRDEMDRVNRSDSRYLQLFTEEHNFLKTEIRLVNEYKIKEDEERELFYTLSTSLRDSQEKERVRIESTKYLQLGLSIACTLLGLVSAYLVNYFRNSNIKEVMRLSNEHFEQTQEILNVLIKKNDEHVINLSKKIESLNVKSFNEQPKIQKPFEENVKVDEKLKQIFYVDKNQSEEVKLAVKKSAPQIPPLKINPYILSASIVIGYIFYLSNK